jgi:hypothetical protein
MPRVYPKDKQTCIQLLFYKSLLSLDLKLYWNSGANEKGRRIETRDDINV